VGVIAGVDASRFFGPVHVDASLLTIQTFYANGHGYEAGDRYAAALGAASALGATRWRLRATVESVWETAESWSGVVHTDDGNIGRVDVLAGGELTWLVTEDWHVGLEVKVPVYTHVKGGQLDALGFAGLSVGTHVHLFEGDEHPHHEPAHLTPADWTGLDKLDVNTDGSAPPLVPVPGKITVFDLWATWCVPCGVVDHELAKLARRYPDDLAVRKVDLSDDDSPASRTFLGRSTLPHLKVFGRDGKLRWERSAPPLVLVGEVEKLLAEPRPPAAVVPGARRIAIEVTEAGFVPAQIEVVHGEPVTLVFTRTTDKTCATDVHIALPDGTRIDDELPLGTPVEVPLAADRPQEIDYVCGMNMTHGTIIVK
jgi:thiol-disulfide isomerase/thioredoxin